MNRWEKQRKTFLSTLEDYVGNHLVAALPKDTPIREVTVVLRMSRRWDLELKYNKKQVHMLYCRVDYDGRGYDYALLVDGKRNDINLICLLKFIGKAIKAHKRVDWAFSKEGKDYVSKGVVHDTENEESSPFLR